MTTLPRLGWFAGLFRHRPGRAQFVRGLFAVAAFVLISHGCHGPDEDHEPSTNLPTDTQPKSPPAP